MLMEGYAIANVVIAVGNIVSSNLF